MIYEIQIGEAVRKLELTRDGDAWSVALDGQPLPADIALVAPGTISLLLAGRSFTFAYASADPSSVWLAAAGHETRAEVRDPRRRLAQRHFHLTGRARLNAPMAGKVVRLLAELGATVEAGQGLLVLEAMKMQNEVRSPKSGTLVSLAVAAGAAVATGQLLAEVE
ncbi:MAG TPA: biotin/lipoyl-containing protein [Terriglobales bacterium]|nr:biotin/lipoyl-containing protein [Terriglobales bacterium]